MASAVARVARNFAHSLQPAGELTNVIALDQSQRFQAAITSRVRPEACALFHGPHRVKFPSACLEVEELQQEVGRDKCQKGWRADQAAMLAQHIGKLCKRVPAPVEKHGGSSHGVGVERPNEGVQGVAEESRKSEAIATKLVETIVVAAYRVFDRGMRLDGVKDCGEARFGDAEGHIQVSTYRDKSQACFWCMLDGIVLAGWR